MISRRLLAIGASLTVLVLVGGVALAAASGEATLVWGSLTGGTGASASEGGEVALSGSLGQAVVGASSSEDGDVGLGGGYWPGTPPPVHSVALPVVLRSP